MLLYATCSLRYYHHRRYQEGIRFHPYQGQRGEGIQLIQSVALLHQVYSFKALSRNTRPRNMKKALGSSYRTMTALDYQYANVDAIVHLVGHTTSSDKLPPYWSVDANNWVDRDLRLLQAPSSNLERKKTLREQQSYWT